MRESDVALIVVHLANSSPREAHDLVVARPWLLEGGVDEAVGDLLTKARRQGDGPYAEQLERGRRMLQRFREYGADRVLIRDVLERLESLGATELSAALQVVPVDDFQAELRRRIDASRDLGDVLAWDHWVTVSIALDEAGGPNPLQVEAPAHLSPGEVERDALWARQFLDTHDSELQRKMLQNGTLPLTSSRFAQVRLQVKVKHLIAARERDALEVIHLRRSLALAAVAAEADQDPVLAQEVLAGRQVFVEGFVL